MGCGFGRSALNSLVALPFSILCSLCFLCLALATGFRFGEASHRGPSGPSMSFCLGAANVARLSNKVDLVASLIPRAWGIGDAHVAEDQAKPMELVLQQSGRAAQRNLRVMFGVPALYRSATSHGGSWTGVRFVSDFPSVPVELVSAGLDFDSGRLLVGSHHIGHLALTTATVYGAAQSPTVRNPLHSFSHSVSNVVVEACRGPRCILGDFNCDLMEFPEMHQWQFQGRRQLQVVALERWGKPPEPTCKVNHP